MDHPIVITYRQAIHGFTCCLARLAGVESEAELYGPEGGE